MPDKILNSFGDTTAATCNIIEYCKIKLLGRLVEINLQAKTKIAATLLQIVPILPEYCCNISRSL